jgi:hypothetical protein
LSSRAKRLPAVLARRFGGGGGAWLVVVSYRFSGTVELGPLFESVLIFENYFELSPKNHAREF